MPLLTRVNQYRGVNTHFNSHAQNADGGWKSFHTRYIVALGDLLDANLPDGYELSWETSLQIREYDPHTGEPINKAKKPEPAISVWTTQAAAKPVNPLYSQGSAVATPTFIKPAAEFLSRDDELYYTAIVIYELEDENRIPVARIELLSPSNKPGGSNYKQYMAKQDMALRAGGASLTIIDFLHQTELPIPDIPSYVRGETDAYPYTITVIDPRPNLQSGQTRIYGFHVDDPIPTINIPLAADEHVSADFETAYQIAFQASSSFSNRADYSEPPEAFETYMPEDQARILSRMASVQLEN